MATALSNWITKQRAALREWYIKSRAANFWRTWASVGIIVLIAIDRWTFSLLTQEEAAVICGMAMAMVWVFLGFWLHGLSLYYERQHERRNPHDDSPRR